MQPQFDARRRLHGRTEPFTEPGACQLAAAVPAPPVPAKLRVRSAQTARKSGTSACMPSNYSLNHTPARELTPGGGGTAWQGPPNSWQLGTGPHSVRACAPFPRPQETSRGKMATRNEGDAGEPPCPFGTDWPRGRGLLNTSLTPSITEDEVVSFPLGSNVPTMSGVQELQQYACTRLHSSWSAAQRQGRRAEVRIER